MAKHSYVKLAALSQTVVTKSANNIPQKVPNSFQGK